METFYGQICKLYELELYEDVILLSELSDARTLSPPSLATFFAICADSYYQVGNYAKSQEAFYHAISCVKSLSSPLPDQKYREEELKFRLHKCLLKQNKREEAISVLGSISEVNMPVKVKASLARLYAVSGKPDKRSSATQATRNSLIYYKKVVGECPEAVDALSVLLRNGISLTSSLKWGPTVHIWLAAQKAVGENNGTKAISLLSTVAGNNHRIITEMGRLHHLIGERQKALLQLQKAHSLDCSSCLSMDLLAFILAQDQKVKELEDLAASLMESHESFEAWIAYAFLAKCQRKSDAALYFAEKASQFSEHLMNPMVVLVKSFVLIEKGRFDEAVQLLRDALMFSPDNFDLHEALVHAYLLQDKMQEALLSSCNCRHQFGEDNARALYLYATVTSRDESTIKDAQEILEQAISTSPDLLDAVFLLVDLYDRTQNYEKAVALLRKQTETIVNSRLHRILGDFLSKTNRPIDACRQYTLAVDGDANASKAMNALESTPGMSTSECIAPAICPGAPRKRPVHR
ncbi:hypothetical protein AB6A40_004139 [Gnathostoma spinigerum]|uniref:Anaphase-promoting complex subunit 7 n=1 Tax=Gnathostoma spinigerum TaxID=75299 RepID=A0ABD6EMC1_9BILA